MVLDPVEFARHDILRDPMDNVSWCPKCDEAPPCRWNRVLAALAATEQELTERAQRDSVRLAEIIRLESDLRLAADRLAAAEAERDQARANADAWQAEALDTRKVILGYWEPRAKDAEQRAARLAALEAAARVWEAETSHALPISVSCAPCDMLHAAVRALDTTPAAEEGRETDSKRLRTPAERAVVMRWIRQDPDWLNQTRPVLLHRYERAVAVAERERDAARKERDKAQALCNAWRLEQQRQGRIWDAREARDD